MNNLNQPSTLGPLIAAAFLATLIGVGSANVVFLPMANRLKELSEAELHFREMTLEGILAIQAGDNPRVVEEKLMAYVPPKQRPTEEDQGGGRGGARSRRPEVPAVSAARRHKKHHHEEHENHERWLVSGYDMMTLLFAVFVVLFAISSTNVCKVKELTKSLQEAFSGPVLSGGQAMMDRGNQSEAEKAVADPAAVLDLAGPGRRRGDAAAPTPARPPTRPARAAPRWRRRRRSPSRRSRSASTRSSRTPT